MLKAKDKGEDLIGSTNLACKLLLPFPLFVLQCLMRFFLLIVSFRSLYDTMYRVEIEREICAIFVIRQGETAMISKPRCGHHHDQPHLAPC